MKQMSVRKLELFLNRDPLFSLENEEGSQMKLIKSVYDIKCDSIINLNTQFNELSY